MGSSSKYNCGNIIASSCVPYTGADLTFLTTVELQAFPCDANINDIVFYIDKYLKKLNDSNNFTGLDKECFDFDPLTIDAKGLHQLEITKICLMAAELEALAQLVQNLNIGSETVTLNLGCLTPDAEPCEVSPNVYTLQSILQLFASKLCDHETRISNLEL